MRRGPGTKRGVKIAVSLLWYSGGAVARLAGRLAGGRPEPRFVVIYYHRVPAAARAEFARQLDALERRLAVLPAADVGSVAPPRDAVAITFDDAFRSVLENAVPELTRRALPATIFVPVEFVGRAPTWEMETAGDPDDEVITDEELRALPELVELGSHTLRHPRLTSVADDVLEAEVRESRERLERLVGASVRLLAFPYGEHDDRVVEVCRRAGYERVFGIEPRPADRLGRDFVRGRIAVEPTDGALEFFLKTRGAYAWMVHVSALKRRLRARR